MPLPADLTETLQKHQQSHLVTWWDELNAGQRQNLENQLRSIDWEHLESLLSSAKEDSADEIEQRARQAKPPETLVGINDSAVTGDNQTVLRELGESLLRAGKIGAIVVAGGQGSRLGFDHAKGLFPIGPVSNDTLFDFLCGQIASLSKRYGVEIPYYIMTSDATHDEVTTAFQEHNWYGLNSSQVKFFKQGHMPAVDAQTGQLLLSGKDSLALSPDGHGGMVAALKQQGILDDMRQRGLEQIFYHQVDNPCLKICDPEFLGLHAQTDSEMSTKVVRKVSPEEKMGLLVTTDGKTQIIEYSDLPEDVAAESEADGSLRFWAGNTACHAFTVAFLDRLAESSSALPFHKAFKKVSCLDEAGTIQEPDSPNAFKFERFIFDALPEAKVALVVETSREREFNPVKNAEGSDSPATCQSALAKIWRSWLADAGIELNDALIVEIQPSFALDASDVIAKRDQVEVPAEGTLLLK